MDTVIAVLMSTYNGQRYIEQQLDSLFAQVKTSVHLFIRDDGSTDKTVSIIKNYGDTLTKNNKITIVDDVLGNIGVYESWNELLKSVPRIYRYYAICDQDDIWHSEKLTSAVDALRSCRTEPCIYTCNTTAVDRDLNVLKEYRFDCRPNTIESLFVRCPFPGHVMVWNEKTMALLDMFDEESISMIPSIEQRIMLSCLACGGRWIRDQRSYVSWRRNTGSNVTPFGNGLHKRLLTEWRLFASRNIKTNWARALLNTFEGELAEDSEVFLRKVVSCRYSIITRIAISRDKRFTSGITTCDIIAKLRVLLPEW